jgi:hypothetical protein
MTMKSEEIRNMTDEQLRMFLQQYMGIAAKPGWSRDRLLNALMSASASAENY